MLFDTPITYRKRNGEMNTLAEFRPLLIDDVTSRIVVAYLLPAPGRITLWAGAAYDAAGDYTQEQAEARIREAISSDPGRALSAIPPAPPPQVIPVRP